MLSIAAYSPHFALKDYIKGYWHLHFCEGMAATYETHAVPHVLQMICFDLSNSNTIFDVEKAYYPSGDYVIGQMTEIKYFNLASNFNHLTVMLQPGGFYRLLGIPANVLTGQYASLYDLVPKSFHGLGDRLKACKDIEARVALLDDFFLKQLVKSNPPSREIGPLAQYIVQKKGTLSMAELESLAFVSKRTAERMFLHQTGILPKLFTRLVRFNEVLKFVQLAKEVRWTDIAHEFGYYDQSHFTSDFKQFTGMLPKNYLQQQSYYDIKMTDE